MGAGPAVSTALADVANHSRLVAFELESGKIAWEHPAPLKQGEDTEKELAGSFYLGAAGNNWYPAIAAGPNGQVVRAFDSYRGGDYDVVLHFFTPTGAISFKLYAGSSTTATAQTSGQIPANQATLSGMFFADYFSSVQTLTAGNMPAVS